MPPHGDNCPFRGAAGFSIYKFKTLESTTLFLKSQLNHYPDFTVITTENQYGGKGRFERKWQSVAGKSLTFSIKIPLEKIPQKSWSNITQIMALSVALLLEDFRLCARIRWPNDVLVGGAKICGILAEALPLESGSWMILGVGLNVNESKNDFSNLDRAATSLFVETGKTFQINGILEKLLPVFKDNLRCIAEPGFSELVAMISNRLYKPDGLVQVVKGSETFSGRIAGITQQGTILIETQSGVEEVISGEITSRIG